MLDDHIAGVELILSSVFCNMFACGNSLMMNIVFGCDGWSYRTEKQYDEERQQYVDKSVHQGINYLIQTGLQYYKILPKEYSIRFKGTLNKKHQTGEILSLQNFKLLSCL